MVFSKRSQMKMTIDQRVSSAQRDIQRELLFDDCSVVMRPDSFNGRKMSDTVIPVAAIIIPDTNDFSAVSRKVHKVIGEYELCAVSERRREGDGLVISVYVRKPDPEANKGITFGDIVEEIQWMIKNRSLGS